MEGHSQVSGSSTLGGWDARDWRGHRQDKGQVSGSQGWEWTCRLCVPGGPCLFGCRQESRVPASGWRGKLGADSVREKVHKQRIGTPPCGGHLGLALEERGCEVQKGPLQTCLFRSCPTGHDVVLSQGVPARPSLPCSPGSREQQHKGINLFFRFR